MKTKTATIILSNIMISEMNKTLTFREITKPDEVEKAFRLRYEEYSKSRVSPILKKNEEKVDMDIFDLHSRHFGLFTNKNEMIGGIRVVLDRKEFYHSGVFEIGKKYGIFTDASHAKDCITNSPMADFPFLSYSNLPEKILCRYNEMKEKHTSFAECSRLIIKESFRGIKFSVFLIDCAMMLFMEICSRKKHAILGCYRDHGAFYKRMGFIHFGDDQGYLMFEKIADVLYLPSDLSTMPNHLRIKFEQLAIKFSKTGKITKAI